MDSRRGRRRCARTFKPLSAVSALPRLCLDVLGADRTSHELTTHEVVFVAHTEALESTLRLYPPPTPAFARRCPQRLLRHQLTDPRTSAT